MDRVLVSLHLFNAIVVNRMFKFFLIQVESIKYWTLEKIQGQLEVFVKYCRL